MKRHTISTSLLEMPQDSRLRSNRIDVTGRLLEINVNPSTTHTTVNFSISPGYGKRTA
ncbi:MAG: hypothetical protein R3F19_24020 [Verrucomicrobiales bacterium]